MAGGGGLPWQVRAFAGGGDTRMPAYKVAMALGIGGAAWWWWSQQKDVAQKQEAAVEQFGAHGEKTEYGKSFQQTVQSGQHFPGIPTTDTNTAGGHAGGAKTPRAVERMEACSG